MSPKHIDISYRADNGQWHGGKAWFPEETFTSASGNIYQLGRYLNKGSNDTLFQCFLRSKVTQQPNLAVKFLHKIDNYRKSRFEFEELVLSDLKHPNILHCHDAGEITTTLNYVQVPFIITDLFKGNIQFQITSQGPLQPLDVKHYVLDLCNALQYIHDQGVVHRDIKPSNIFISWQNSAILGDFGIAKTATDFGETRYPRDDITIANEFVGPLLWLSPELSTFSQNKLHPVDHRSDLFQLGLVIWYLLTKEIPRGIIDESDDPSDGQFYHVVQKLLRQKPDKRLQTASAVKSMVEQINI
ncbi:MAG: serine/threonine protein kinase [Magnetococcus sp. DMHC-1]